jgi:DNA mismatch repair protein MutS
MQIDAATRRNLELTQRCRAAATARFWPPSTAPLTAGQGPGCLNARLSGPSRDLAEIRARLDAVRYLVEAMDRLATALRADLRRVPDIDRALSRLALDRGGPRDLAPSATA